MGSRFWLVAALLASGCEVEDVIVDTGGPAVDTGPSDTDRTPDPPRERPENPVDTGSPAPEAALTLTPNPAEIGAATLLFVESDDASVELNRVVDVALYGEPDVTLHTWTADGSQRLVLSIEVPASSPAGEVLVVLERDDGSVLRPDEALRIR